MKKLWICLLLLPLSAVAVIRAIPSIEPVQHAHQHITEINLNKNAGLTRTIYHQAIDLSGQDYPDFVINQSRFNQHLMLDNCHINGPADITWSRFLSTTDLTYNDFLNDLTVRYSQFANPVLFYKNHCHTDCALQNNQFNGLVSLARSQFDGALRLTQSIFKKPVNLSYSTIMKTLNMTGAVFDAAVTLDHVTIHGAWIAKNTHFNAPVHMRDFLLPKYIDFSGLHTETTLNLRHVSRTNKRSLVKINLLKTNISKILIDYQRFQLFFPPKTPYSQRMYVYTQLLKQFKQADMKVSFNRLYRESQQYQYHMNNQHLLNILDQIWWDYGLQKDRIFLWIMILLLGFSTINTLLYRRLVENFFDIKFLTNTELSQLAQANCIIRFIQTFPRALLFTAYILFSGFINIRFGREVFKSNHLLINAYLMLISGIGFICILFIIEMLISRI